MRVALIAPPYIPVPPPAYGGTEAVLDGLARGLRAAGHDVLLVTTGDATCPVERTWCHETAVGLGAGGEAAELAHVAHGYRAADDWGADVVHDHTTVGPRLAAAAGRLNVVATNHGPFLDPALGDLYRSVSGIVSVVAISGHQASTAPEGTSIAAVIHHGVTIPRPPDRVGPPSSSEGFALFLGRMDPSKGVERAIELARAAGVRLVVGAKMREPHEVAYFREQVEPLLDDDRRYVGEVAGRCKLDLLRRASVLLNPIRWAEPFGMVMIEALACGTPVVAPPLGSVPEIVVDGVTGFVCDDDDAVVTALRAVHRLDRRACREDARRRFSVEAMVRHHLRLYRNVAAAGRSQAVPA